MYVNITHQTNVHSIKISLWRCVYIACHSTFIPAQLFLCRNMLILSQPNFHSIKIFLLPLLFVFAECSPNWSIMLRMSSLLLLGVVDLLPCCCPPFSLPNILAMASKHNNETFHLYKIRNICKLLSRVPFQKKHIFSNFS